MKDSDISILIPTLSRPDFLLKNLRFLVKLKADFNVCICDSSPNIKINFRKKLNKLSKIIKINYTHKPSFNCRQALFFLLNNCKTDYAAYLGDDDFFIPNGLIECANFLSNNRDYRVAYGKSITVDSETIRKPNLNIKASSYWESRSFEESKAKLRLDSLSDHYLVNLFGVHRTKEFLKDFEPSSVSPSRSMSEILVNYITLAKGKGKFLPVTYLIRQTHQSRYLMSRDLINILIEDNFAESIPLFISELSIALKSKKNFSDQKSNSLSKKYLRRILEKYRNTKKNKIFSIWKKIFRRIKYSLKNLIFRHSNYFKDFKIYLNIISQL